MSLGCATETPSQNSVSVIGTTPMSLPGHSRMQLRLFYTEYMLPLRVPCNTGSDLQESM